MPGQLTLQWPTAVSAGVFRFAIVVTQGKPIQPIHYQITCDKDGDGVFETVLIASASTTQALADQTKKVGTTQDLILPQDTKHLWFAHDLKQTKLHGIRITALSAYRSYLADGPDFSQVQLYVPLDTYTPTQKMSAWHTDVPANDMADITLAHHAATPMDQGPDALEHYTSIAKGVFVEGRASPWNMQLRRAIERDGIERIETTQAFSALVAQLHDLGVDQLHCLHPQNTDSSLVWKTDDAFRPTASEDLLHPLSAALKKHGIEMGGMMYAYAFWNKNQYDMWKFPREEYDVNPADKPYGCILNGDFYREAWTKKTLDMLGAGGTLPGGVLPWIYVIGDEYYYKSHGLPIPKDDPCRAAYQKRYGHAVPTAVGNTQAYRDWIDFIYQRQAQLTAHFAGASKEASPTTVTAAGVGVNDLLRNNRMKHGLALDVLGRRGDVDYLVMNPYLEGHVGMVDHYFVSEAVKYLAACTPGGKSGVFVQGARIGGQVKSQRLFRPVDVYGQMLGAVMHGAKYLALYRLDYLAKTWDDAKRGFTAIKALEPLGFVDARPVPTIALCLSRSGEDWYWVTQSDKAKKARGQASSEMMIQWLQRQGYPFDIYFLDYPQELAKLGQYPLVIAPFPYAISQEASTQLQAAADAGSSVLIMQTKGEVDQKGVQLGRPRLSNLVESGQAQYMDVDLLAVGTKRSFHRRLRQTIDAMLGDRSAFQIQRYGKDVEATMLVHANGRMFIPMINWEDAPVHVTFTISGLKMDQPMSVLTPEGWRTVHGLGNDSMSFKLPQNGFAVWVIDKTTQQMSLSIK